jgi:hypothetical protein
MLRVCRIGIGQFGHGGEFRRNCLVGSEITVPKHELLPNRKTPGLHLINEIEGCATRNGDTGAIRQY